jgi:TctA family transporter
MWPKGRRHLFEFSVSCSSWEFYLPILFPVSLIGTFIIEFLNNFLGRTNCINVMHYANVSLSFLSWLIIMESRSHFMIKRVKNVDILMVFGIMMFILSRMIISFLLPKLTSFSYIHVCVYIYIHVYVYTCIYVYIYIYILRSPFSVAYGSIICDFRVKTWYWITN